MILKDDRRKSNLMRYRISKPYISKQTALFLILLTAFKKSPLFIRNTERRWFAITAQNVLFVHLPSLVLAVKKLSKTGKSPVGIPLSSKRAKFSKYARTFCLKNPQTSIETPKGCLSCSEKESKVRI